MKHAAMIKAYEYMRFGWWTWLTHELLNCQCFICDWPIDPDSEWFFGK